MSESLIRESVRRLNAYVPGEQPADSNIIKLNTNENPYAPSPQVESALLGFDSARLRMYPPPTSVALRARIAELHGCTLENVFAGNGSDEVLALCTRAFVENDGNIGFFDPSYSLYPVLADIRDVRHLPVPLGDRFSWRQPPSEGCSLFFLTNPNAPTGMRFDKLDIETFCASFQGVVLIDEAYVDFASENCMDLALRYNNVLVSRTLSKSYSLAGLRVGYVIGAPDLIEAMFKVKDSYNLDGISQVLALAALNDVEYMRNNVSLIVAQRERLSAALRQMKFEVFSSETNFIWTKPPAGLPAKTLLNKLRDNGILIRYFSQGELGHYVRITVGTKNEMTALIDAVEMILNQGVR